MKNKMLTCILFLLAFHCLQEEPSSAFAAQNKFYDISSHWAKDEIEQAIAEGWVQGYPNGTFRPNSYVTRAELVKMITRANHIYFGEGSTVSEFLTKPETPAPFRDVQGHWVWRQEVFQPALAWGMVVPSDYGKAGFGANQNATRREVSVMAVRAMGEVAEAQRTNVKLPFTDEAKMPEWLRGYVNVVADAGVVGGYPNGQFGERKLATRAETVAIILRQLAYNRQGIDRGITLEVLGGRKDQQASIITPRVPIQVVDQTIYVPLRDVFFDQKEWSRSNNWHPIKQRLYFYYDVDFSYTAGSNDYGFYGSKVGDLLQPVRVLNGELMLPVYHFEKGRLEPGIFHFDAAWDNENRTITVKPLFVPAPIS